MLLSRSSGDWPAREDYMLVCLSTGNAVAFFATADEAIKHVDDDHVVMGPDDYFYPDPDQ